MKSKLFFEESIDGKITNSFKRIATIQDEYIHFKNEYNDHTVLKILEDKLYIKRKGIINYSIEHVIDKDLSVDILIDGMGINQKINSNIYTKDLSIKKQKNSIIINIVYNKDEEEIITNYKIIWGVK